MNPKPRRKVIGSREVYQMVAGFMLLLTGFVASLLMVVGVVERDIILSLVIYTLSLTGTIVGLYGVLGWFRGG
ncbi:MAG: hypothetical protein QXS57_01605 [Candidatus Caldarchaeum sp.]